MDSLGLEAGIQAELFDEWKRCEGIAEREQLYREHALIERVFKLIRRIASGGT
jgi:hypothetical protein